jgi:hypothetical protein
VLLAKAIAGKAGRRLPVRPACHSSGYQGWSSSRCSAILLAVKVGVHQDVGQICSAMRSRTHRAWALEVWKRRTGIGGGTAHLSFLEERLVRVALLETRKKRL